MIPEQAKTANTIAAAFGMYDAERMANVRLMEQLAASQAREQQLREVLEVFKPIAAYGRVGTRDVEQAWLQKRLETALAIPSDTTALEDLIAKAGEVMRERCLSLRSAHLINSGCVRALPGVTLEDLK